MSAFVAYNDKILLDRTRMLNNITLRYSPVLYWMNRDQRADHNWALSQAQKVALELNQPLFVAFCLMSQFMNARSEHFAFMIKGLIETAQKLQEKNIPFILLQVDHPIALSEFADQQNIGLIVTDFSPLRLMRKWREDLANTGATKGIAIWETDSHNIIPCWKASEKQEYGAFTFRPKVNKKLQSWIYDIPTTHFHPFNLISTFNSNIKMLCEALKTAQKRLNSDGINQKLPYPGSDAAFMRLNDFITYQLENFENRNDPNAHATSRLSPYIHFGQISAQKIALTIMEAAEKEPVLYRPSHLFLEEFIIRRELADNYCFYNNAYDDFSGLPQWAQKTLNDHRLDVRPYLYDYEALKAGLTHDDLWNAAQRDLVLTGSMSGYLRMYWAKKILEWTHSPDIALSFAIQLNDSFALDGRDPNGYTGIAWSIGAVHDRPWAERNIFGKIRYMSYIGCKRKFSIDKYIAKGEYPDDRNETCHS